MNDKTGEPEHRYLVWDNVDRTGDPIEVVASSHQAACAALGLDYLNCYVEEYLDSDCMDEIG